jgi:hypothetical protein
MNKPVLSELIANVKQSILIWFNRIESRQSERINHTGLLISDLIEFLKNDTS